MNADTIFLQELWAHIPSTKKKMVSIPPTLSPPPPDANSNSIQTRSEPSHTEKGPQFNAILIA